MKPLVILLLIAGSVHAQSIADIARKERARQANLKPALVITSTESKAEEAKPGAAADSDEAAKADAKAANSQPSQQTAKAPEPSKLPRGPDPTEIWTNQTNQLRGKIQTLEDQETTLQLQLSQANNQVYAPVTDPATQERALALVGQIQQTLANVRQQLSDTKKLLDAMLLQGPPKK